MAWTGSERAGPRHHRGTAVGHYAGIDVSLERSSVCVVDGTGRIVREAKVPSETVLHGSASWTQRPQPCLASCGADVVGVGSGYVQKVVTRDRPVRRPLWLSLL